MPKSKGRRKPKRSSPPPPQQPAVKESPRWYVVLMFSLMAIGVIVIVLNYIGLFGDFQRPLLWFGLGSIGIGFLLTLNFN